MDETELKKSIGKTLKKERKLRGKSQRELAEIIDYKRAQSISLVEAGINNIPLGKFIILCDAIGIDLDNFFKKVRQPVNSKSVEGSTLMTIARNAAQLPKDKQFAISNLIKEMMNN